MTEMIEGFVAQPLGDVPEHADEVRVPMSDGITLATDVYLPDGLGEALPTVLVRLPYGKNTESAAMTAQAQVFLDRGLAVVVQDVRGRHRSAGEWTPFAAETADSWATLEWIAAQPWSNGAVGMHGASYLGYTQLAAMTCGHPALRAAVPAMMATAIDRDVLNTDGVPNLQGVAGWAAYATMTPGNLFAADGSDLPNLPWSTRPVRDLIPMLFGGRQSAMVDAWTRYRPGDPYWSDTIWRPERGPRLGAVPTLFHGGSYDVMRRGQLRDFAMARLGDLPNDQYLQMDAIDHEYVALTPDGVGVAVVGDPSTMTTARWERHLEPVLRMFDRYLLGRDRSWSRVRWQEGHGELHELESWPPPGAHRLTLRAASGARALESAEGGVLVATRVPVERDQAWVHDPAKPVPAPNDSTWHPLLGLRDESDIQERADVATFSTEPLGAPVRLAGPIRVSLHITARSATTHVIARLTHVRPDGGARLVAEGARLVRRAGQGESVVVDLADQAYRFEEGDVIRLSISTSLLPRYAVHPGTDEDVFDAVDARIAWQRIRIGGEEGVALHLTVI